MPCIVSKIISIITFLKIKETYISDDYNDYIMSLCMSFRP